MKWKVDKNYLGEIVVFEGSSIVCVLKSFSNGGNFRPEQANNHAKLIAAAPELLECLKKTYEFLECIKGNIICLDLDEETGISLDLTISEIKELFSKLK